MANSQGEPGSTKEICQNSCDTNTDSDRINDCTTLSGARNGWCKNASAPQSETWCGTWGVSNKYQKVGAPSLWMGLEAA